MKEEKNVSHYLRAKCNVKSRAGLVAALEELGFHPEVGDAPLPLYGYHGDRRPEQAHVVIRRREVGPSSNDVGFLELEDGSFEAVVSEFDRRRGWGADRLARVAQLAGVHADLAVAAGLGLVAERVDGEGGVIDVYVYSREG